MVSLVNTKHTNLGGSELYFDNFIKRMFGTTSNNSKHVYMSFHRDF